MKRLLILSLLLTSAGAMAQDAQSKGCRVLIGEDWIPMGATTITGCLKYAEAAATPGDRQFAQFGGTQLSYKDGQAFQSTDGGKNWQPLRSSSQGNIGALNTLRAGSDEAALPAVPPKPQTPAPAPAPAPQPSRAAASSAPIMPELEAPVPLDDTAPATPVGSQSAPMAPAAPARPYRAQPSAPAPAAPAITAAPATRSSSGNAAADINQGVPRGCQVHVGNNWQVTPVGSLEECGRVLMNVAQSSGAKSSQAYWAGNYLFYSNGQLYQSTDGQDWRPLHQ